MTNCETDEAARPASGWTLTTAGPTRPTTANQANVWPDDQRDKPASPPGRDSGEQDAHAELDQ
jgi:hypothetical protein